AEGHRHPSAASLGLAEILPHLVRGERRGTAHRPRALSHAPEALRPGLDVPDDLSLRPRQARPVRAPGRPADPRAGGEGGTRARGDPRRSPRRSRRRVDRRGRPGITARGRRSMTELDRDARRARAVLLAAVALHAALLAYVFPWKAFAARLPVFEYD